MASAHLSRALCLVLPCLALCLVPCAIAACRSKSTAKSTSRVAAKSVTRPHKEIIHFKQADKQWNCLNSYDDNDCSLSALFFCFFCVCARRVCWPCRTWQAPEISKRFCCTHFVVTVLLLLLFSSVRFFSYILRLCWKLTKCEKFRVSKRDAVQRAASNGKPFRWRYL